MPLCGNRASLVAQMVKNLPAMQETQGSIPGSGRSPREGKWQPTPQFLPGGVHGQRNLLGYSPWGRQELDTTKRLSLQHYVGIPTGTFELDRSLYLWLSFPLFLFFF